MERSMMDLDACNAKILDCMAARIERMGADDSGAYNYYTTRVGKGEGLTDYERALFAVVSGRPRVFHVGIGFGTLTATLAADGTQCIGFESDTGRFGGAEAVSACLGAGAALELRHAPYPDALGDDDATREATLLFTNFGSAVPDEVEQGIVATFPRFASVILDPRLFCRTREDAEARAALIARIEALGYRHETVYVDATYRFLEFTPVQSRMT